MFDLPSPFLQGIRIDESEAMSYLVLARKWRPAKFEDIVGQGFVTKTLQNAITSGRVAHAFLFTGARGVGKTSMARILAKSLNCENGPTVSPCNECENCKEITAGNCIDVLEIDGASNRGIDEVRELRENIKYFPSKSRNKIYIIDEVHMLTKEAFNALLKTLEEPPAHAVFIFATTEPHKIPITILSRCQRFDFKKISLKDICAHLKFILGKEGVKLSDASILQVAKAANGSMRDSQSILDQIISFGGANISDEDVNNILGVIDRSIIYSLVKAVLQKDAGMAFQVINNIYNYGYDINQFCFNILETFRDIIAFKVSKDPKELLDLSDGELSEIEGFAKDIDVNELLLIFNILYKAEEDITKSLTPKMILEMSVMKMINRFPVMPLAALMKKISLLEKRLPRNSGNVIDMANYPPKTVKSGGEKRPVSIAPPAPRAGASTKDFLEFLKDKSILIYSHVESLKAFDVKGDEIIITPTNSYTTEYFESSEIQSDLKQFAHDFFRRNFQILIKKVEKKGENSLYSNNGRKSNASKSSQRMERVLKGEGMDPVFSQVKELFEGEIIDFKYL